MPREPEWLPRLFSGIWRFGGEFAVEAVGGGGEGAAGDGGGAEFAAELVDGLVELAGAVALFVGEEGELLVWPSVRSLRVTPSRRRGRPSQNSAKRDLAQA